MLGVYPSALHVRWTLPSWWSGDQRVVGALAVADEPTVFWDGTTLRSWWRRGSHRLRAEADALFGFNGSERQARTDAGWLTTDRADPLLAFCSRVAEAYAAALKGESGPADDRRAALDRMVDISEGAGMYEATAEPTTTR